jgi:DNA mismatch repair protein MutL
VESVEDVAAAPGTRIEIQDLFFNTPARKKFLKSPTTEFSHILQAIQQAALAWPSVQFRLIHNGNEVLHCPSVPSLRDRLLQIYRDSLLGHMVPVCRERAGIRIEGVTIGAAHLRGVRTPQELFVNRRPVKNATILHAVTDAYGPQIARGRYPQFVLFLDVDPARLDVNVHPAKREVRFADKDLIHQSVRQAVKDALSVGAGSSDAGATSIARVIEESLG